METLAIQNQQLEDVVCGPGGPYHIGEHPTVTTEREEQLESIITKTTQAVLSTGLPNHVSGEYSQNKWEELTARLALLVAQDTMLDPWVKKVLTETDLLDHKRLPNGVAIIQALKEACSKELTNPSDQTKLNHAIIHLEKVLRGLRWYKQEGAVV